MHTKINTLFPHAKTAVLFLIIMLEEISSFLLAPIIAQMASKGSPLLQGFSTNELPFFYGAFLAITPFFYCIGAPLLGSLSDRFGRKKLLVICLSGTLISNLLYITGFHAQQIVFLLLARMLEGLTNGSQAIAQASIADNAIGKSRTLQFGVIGAALTVGLIVGPISGGYLAENPSLLFTVILSITALSLIALILGFPDTPQKTNARIAQTILKLPQRLRVLFQLQPQKLKPYFLSFFLFELAWSLYYFSIPLSLSQHFSQTAKTVGLFMSSIGLMLFFSLIRLLPIVLKRKTHRFLLKSSLCFLILGAITAMLNHLISFMFAGVMIAVGVGFTYPILISLLSECVKAEEQGLLMGLTDGLLAIAFTLSELLTGLLFNTWFALPYLVAGLLFMGALCVSHLDKKAAAQKLPPPPPWH